MKKAAGVLLGVFFGLTVLTGVAFAADKFAYVDLSRLFSEYGKAKDYDKALIEKQNVYEAEREKKVSDVKQFQEKLNLLSEKEKESKQADMQAKVKTLQEYDRQKQTDLRKEQDEKLKEIFKDIEEAVKKYAEKEGYTMVFENRVFVYKVKSLDISDKVSAILNSGNSGNKKK